jgi:hypothetical protein
MPTVTTLMLAVLVPAPVHAMATSFQVPLLTFKKESGTYSLISVLPEPPDPYCRQMNIDYAICNALKYQTAGMEECLINYDVCCQWYKNFHRRVDNSTTLSIPPNMSIIPGIGKFHLGGHVKECFALFSLNFILGAGQQDGEILETLWASLNKASGSIRAMSKAHRQEYIDALMRDSNWKKTVRMSWSFTTVLTISSKMIAQVNRFRQNMAWQ